MRKVKLLMLLLFLLGVKISNGQDVDVPKISLKYGILAKPFKDSIVIRWALESSNGIPAHLDAGVWIEKKVVSGKFPYKIGPWERINENPIKPLPLEAFNNDKAKSDNYAMLGAQLFYGKLPPSLSKSEVQQVKDQSSMLNSLFSMAMLGCDYSPLAAQMLGMRTVIKGGIKENEKVFFRIYSAFDHPLFQVDTAMTFSTYQEIGATFEPKFLSTTCLEKLVELKWPFNKELYRWSGFYIERSTDKINFKRLNTKPFMIMSPAPQIDMFYRDSVANYVKYYYRVQAIDPFGDLSEYSEYVLGFGRDRTPPEQLVLDEHNDKGNGINLSWRFESKKPEADLDHFVVKSGSGVNAITDTIIILPKSTYTYFYNGKATKKSTYFEVMAVDTAGNYSASNPVRYFIPDTEPPLVPKQFTATIDTMGIVRLNWQLDTLDELIGYRVFRKNDIKHEYVALQQGYLTETSFTDTLSLQTLTKEIYYAVAAIDLSYNMSQLTDPIKLIKPDKIPPVAPQIIHYNLRSKSATIEWRPSPSDDVAYYQLFRKDESGKIAIIEKNIGLNQTQYTDTSLVDHKKYIYYLKSVDEAGLSSDYSFPLEILAYANNAFKKISLTWLTEKERIGFKWVDPNLKPEFYIVYKDGGSGLEQYKNVEAEKDSFFENIQLAAKIRYGLQAVYPNQVKSDIYTLEWINSKNN